MDREAYALLENYMLFCMESSSHDKAHVYRVLYTAMEIGAAEEDVDRDVLIAACLLHDIGRPEQYADTSLCHARAGAEKARRFLAEKGFGEDFAAKVAHCISAHRFRGDNPPETTEAKILFDADKLDVTGAIGIARTLLYAGETSASLYSLDGSGNVSDGKNDSEETFFGEYHFKLKNIYDRFYTRKGRELAEGRREAAAGFYEALLGEVRAAYENGREELEKNIK